MYHYLSFGRTTDRLEGDILKDLLLLIADQANGYGVALEILYMRLYSDCMAQREYDQGLIEAGRELLKRATFGRCNQQDDHKQENIAKACLSGPDAGPVAAEIAGRLRRAVATRDTFLFDNDNLLRALLELQPAAVLDALFAGNESEQRAVVDTFDFFDDHRGNPADAIPCDTLIAWCERDREHRYPLAASIITFACRPEASGLLAWSVQAKTLLARAPEPRIVLSVFIDRFRPMSWSGSRAAIIEANARLLDQLESLIPSNLMPFVSETKAQLTQEVVQRRQRETAQDQERDERFE